ncbi:hypothetical protein EON65_32035 [archaeon]|nr:MAG: hypothetical protein EON65_32035 [archaeon]
MFRQENGQCPECGAILFEIKKGLLSTKKTPINGPLPQQGIVANATAPIVAPTATPASGSAPSAPSLANAISTSTFRADRTDMVTYSFENGLFFEYNNKSI